MVNVGFDVPFCSPPWEILLPASVLTLITDCSVAAHFPC